MGLETLVGGALGLVGSGMQADSASDAAAAQERATAEANARLERQFQQTRDDLSPWRTSGTQANNRLSQLLGLGGVSGGRQAITQEQARAQLLPQFTQTNQSAPSYGGYFEPGVGWVNDAASSSQQSMVDESGLNEAIRQLMASSGEAPDSNAADYGSLLKNFTGQDLQNEPGYQFGLNEGLRAQDQSAASRGMLLSGAALKGAQRFGNDYASTKFGDAYNRDSNNKTRTYNFLSGQSSAGQNAAAQTGTMGTNISSQVANNMTNLGNAQGASAIAQGNAWSGGLNNAVSNYQQNELLKKITGGNTGWSSGGWGTGNKYGNQDLADFL